MTLRLCSIINTSVLIADADRKHCRTICTILQNHGFGTESVYSLASLERRLMRGKRLVVVLDFDSLSIDNRTVRRISTSHPGVSFLGLSDHRFGPEFREAICHHLYACLKKPIDPEELIYLVRSIYEDMAS